MITLSEGFKLLNLKEEPVYLRNYKDSYHYDEYFYSEHIKKYFNMKKIHIIKIERHFTYNDESGQFYTLLINLTREEIIKAKTEINKKYFNKRG